MYSSNKNIEPKIILVGAGPGDPELLTLKAIKAIENANVILYDALTDKQILNFSKKGCKHLYVGKRKGCKSSKQTTINELLVFCAKKYGTVVRLKGGDPFVFGRGFEEIAFAHRNGIKTELIPGVSSCIAVPQSFNIPVTHRGTSESFWVCTGMLEDGSISKDIHFAAQSNATVVILMGSSRIKEIMTIFNLHRSQDTPVAVLSNGTWNNESELIGTIHHFENNEYDIARPAIIVIGEVVALKESLFQNFSNKNEEIEYL